MLYTIISLLDVFPRVENTVKSEPPRSTDPFSYLEQPKLTQPELLTPSHVIRSQPL